MDSARGGRLRAGNPAESGRGPGEVSGRSIWLKASFRYSGKVLFLLDICSKNTKIEVILRKALWKRGYRYRKNYKELPGKPDIVLTKYKIAIFCDGEFFHGKDWEVLKPRLEK